MLKQLDIITSLDLLRDIVQQDMGIKDDRIFIYGQEYNLPTDRNLFVIIEFKYAKPYSNRNLTPVVDNVISEEQNLNAQEFLTIQIFSRSFEALQRRFEPAMALKSIYAQQLQEKYSFKLSWNPQILDLSILEESAMLYRFDLPVIMLTAYQKTKPVTWFDSFTAQVDVNDGEPDMIVDINQPTESFPT